MMTMSREAVIVAVDANRSKGSVEAVEWALSHLVRPGDILLVLGVLLDDHLGNPKKHSCFPFKLLMGTGTCTFFIFISSHKAFSIRTATRPMCLIIMPKRERASV